MPASPSRKSVVARKAALTSATLLLLAVALLGACSIEPSPALLDVQAFAPSSADLGDRLEVLGASFPEGKTATLTFRGDLYRRGREPIRDVEIVARATSTARARLSLVLDEALQAEFCGRGDAADHTTFRGEVVAAFSPKKPGAPPISGVVRDIVLDVESPPPSKQGLTLRKRDGERALEFFGFKLRELSRPERLIVDELTKDSRAERAGLQPGDALIALDGLMLRTASDLVPSGDHRFATISFRRGRTDGFIERTIDVSGFNPVPPSELGVAALLVGLAVAIVLVFVAPLSRVLTWAERRAAGRLRASGNQGSVSSALAQIGRGLREALSFETLPTGARAAPYLGLLGISAVLTLLAFGRPLILAEIDVLGLLTCSSTVLVTLGWISGGFVGSGPWSVRRALGRTFSIFSLQLPLYAVVVSIVLATGSLRPDDVVLAQGAAPWRWHALNSPMLLLGFLIALLTTVPEASPARELPEADAGGVPTSQNYARSPSRPSRTLTQALMTLGEWCHLLVVCGVLSLLLLGGYRLPLISTSTQINSSFWQALGAVVLLAKAWALVLSVVFLRWMVGRIPIVHMLGPTWRWFVPLSALSVLLTAAWIHGLQTDAVRSVGAGVSHVLFALSVFMLGHFAVRVASNLKSSRAELSVNPWI